MTFHRRVTSQQGYSNLRACAAALVFIATLVSESLAHADTTFNVNTVADQVDPDVADGICLTSTGACSLRAAIMQANHLVGPGTTHIILPAGTYTLTRPPAGPDGEDSGNLNLTAPLSNSQVISIEGASAASSVIDANQIDSVMNIAIGRVASLSKVTVRGGYVVNLLGGGIFSEGTLTMVDSIVEANTTTQGGGGIFAAGALDIRRSIFRSNSARFGGAVFVRSTTIIRESSMYDNVALDGGAIQVLGSAPAATLYVLNSTISNNFANGDGGGIRNEGSTWLYNTSIISNDSSHDRNPPGGAGGGVSNQPGKSLVVINSLIADNTTLDAPIPDDCNGVLEAYGWNLLSDYGGCSFSGNGTAARGLVSTNTIGPLADNGGPTFTHALLAGSEAINTTLAQGCVDNTGATLATDQRGAPRIAGAKCDVGAYEFGSAVPATDVVFSNGFD